MPSRGRLILAEDDAIALIALESHLSAEGYDICGITSTGPGAVRLAELHRPDLAILDVKLRDRTSGLTAAVEILDRFGIPTIFVSGHLTQDAAEAAGAVGYLAKPYREADLAALVAAVLTWRREGVPSDPLPVGFIRSGALSNATDPDDVTV